MPETRDNPERGTAAVIRAFLELDRMLVTSPGWERVHVARDALEAVLDEIEHDRKVRYRWLILESEKLATEDVAELSASQRRRLAPIPSGPLRLVETDAQI
jgi:hypothetical protein